QILPYITKDQYSIQVLNEAIEVQRLKGMDYNSGSIKQAMYYPRGIQSMLDTIQSKIYRITSISETTNKPNNESIEDSFIDIINTASFAVSFLRKQMDGQDISKDHLNK